MYLFKSCISDSDKERKYLLNMQDEIDAAIKKLQLMGFDESRVLEAIKSKQALDIDTIVEEIFQLGT